MFAWIDWEDNTTSVIKTTMIVWKEDERVPLNVDMSIRANLGKKYGICTGVVVAVNGKWY